MNRENTRKMLLPHLEKAKQKLTENVQKLNHSYSEMSRAEDRANSAERENENLKLMIRKVYPQFKGMIECALYLAVVGKTSNVTSKCSYHFTVPMKMELRTGCGGPYLQ